MTNGILYSKSTFAQTIHDLISHSVQTGPAGTLMMPRGWKTRHLKRKRQAGRSTPSSSRTDNFADDEEEAALFKEYLKSEIKKNSVIIEKLQQDMEEREERRKRKLKESSEKLTLYQNMNEKVVNELKKYKEEGPGTSVTLVADDPLEEIFYV